MLLASLAVWSCLMIFHRNITEPYVFTAHLYALTLGWTIVVLVLNLAYHHAPLIRCHLRKQPASAPCLTVNGVVAKASE